MNYLIKEGMPKGAFNASSKARTDVDEIFNEMGIREKLVETEYGVQSNKLLKWKQFFIYHNNLKKWQSILPDLNVDDKLFIQYPLLNTTSDFSIFLKECKLKRIHTIAIIHDLDSLRFTEENSSAHVVKRVKKEDCTFLQEFSRIICHNHAMKVKLIEMGLKEKNIIELGIFDYKFHSEVNNCRFDLKKPIVIAGNLNPQKVGYLGKLNQLINIEFNLYGVGFLDRGYKNIHYLGAFEPEQLITKIDGSFGLVWDGNSLEECTGGYGGYLKYNNPHKTSMYICAGLPVIVWRQSAIAKFVLNNNIGLAVNTLEDIPQTISKLTTNDYQNMKMKCMIISKRIKNGYYMRQAVEAAIE